MSPCHLYESVRVTGVSQVSTVCAMSSYATSAGEISRDVVAINRVTALREVDLDARQSHCDDTSRGVLSPDSCGFAFTICKLCFQDVFRTLLVDRFDDRADYVRWLLMGLAEVRDQFVGR